MFKNTTLRVGLELIVPALQSRAFNESYTCIRKTEVKLNLTMLGTPEKDFQNTTDFPSQNHGTVV